MRSKLEASERRASEGLPRSVYDYYAGGAGDERTIEDNITAFRSLHFLPRCFRTSSSTDTTVSIPGIGTLSMPVIVAPMAMQKLAHPDGEIGVARAAGSLRVPYILSTFSTTSLEQVASSVKTPLLFQLYLYKDRNVSARLLERARKAGYKAIVLTVDAPRFGRRERDFSNKFALPPHLTLANFTQTHSPELDGVPTPFNAFSQKVEDVLTFDAVKWVVRNAGLPVWVKGVIHPKDALIAIDAGVSAIVVSNHGGRQLAGVLPTIHALPSVVSAVNGRVPVLVDSGVRSGEDVIRAIALGASAVLLGRPVLWSLSESGEKGVSDLLLKFHQVIDLTMILCGVSKINQISSDLVVSNWQSKL